MEQNNLGNNAAEINFSKKTIVLGAVAFWLLGYTISSFIFFLERGFSNLYNTNLPLDNFYSLFSIPFKIVLFEFPWFYVFPIFLLTAILSKKCKETSMMVLTIASYFICSLLVFGFFFFLQIFVTAPFEIKTPGSMLLIQLVLYSAILFVFKTGREKIIPKILLIVLLLFFIFAGYIAIYAKNAMRAESIFENLISEAKSTANPSFCDKILSEAENMKISEAYSVNNINYPKCIEAVAIVKDDVGLCKKLSYDLLIARCVGAFAKNISDPSLCYSEYVKSYHNDLYSKECLKIYNTSK